jgi:Zn-finger nucleic acid-binding protein
LSKSEERNPMYICPRCKGSLTTLTKDNVEIEECSNCGGFWLDANELRLLIGTEPDLNNIENEEYYDETIDVEEDDRNEYDSEVIDGPKADNESQETNEMLCPKCSEQNLVSFIYDDDTGIELDCCPQCCGLWLDKNELQQIEFFANMNKETDLLKFKGKESTNNRIRNEDEARERFVDRIRREQKRKSSLFSMLFCSIKL